jgi:hypothetical protein
MGQLWIERHNGQQLSSLMYPGMTIFLTWLAGALESAILGRGQRSGSIMAGRR